MNIVKSSTQGIVIGEFELNPQEMCFIQYLPIKMKNEINLYIPPNLEWVKPLVLESLLDSKQDVLGHYIYLTVKYLYTSAGYTGNREGWHIDGYLSEDMNYIWYDKFPTEFVEGDFFLSKDHNKSLREMEEQAEGRPVICLPENSLIRVDTSLVHRTPENISGGLRAFVKISFSKHRYNLKGNAHNHLIKYDWKMYNRDAKRNHPYVEEEV